MPEENTDYLKAPGADGPERYIFVVTGLEDSWENIRPAKFMSDGAAAVVKPLSVSLFRYELLNLCRAFDNDSDSEYLSGNFKKFAEALQKSGQFGGMDRIRSYMVVPDWFDGRAIKQMFLEKLSKAGLKIFDILSESYALAASFLADTLKKAPKWLKTGETKHVIIVITGNAETEVISYEIGSCADGRYFVRKNASETLISEEYYRGLLASYLITRYELEGGITGLYPYKEFLGYADRIIKELAVNEKTTLTIKKLFKTAVFTFTREDIKNGLSLASTYAYACNNFAYEARYMPPTSSFAESWAVVRAIDRLSVENGPPERACVYSHPGRVHTARERIAGILSENYKIICGQGERNDNMLLGAGIIAALDRSYNIVQ